MKKVLVVSRDELIQAVTDRVGNLPADVEFVFVSEDGKHIDINALNITVDIPLPEQK